MSTISDWVRATFKQGDDIRDAGLTTPKDIVRYDNIVYGPERNWQVLDVYRPTSKKGQLLPIIVSVHGGGWVYGDKERYQFYCMNLAQRGFAVVNFTYRLAPEFQFPAPLEDTNMVFAWVLDNAERYGFDRSHIFGVGDSAGGHLLGLYCGLCTNPDYAAKYDFCPPEGFAPQAVALNCGAYVIDASAGAAALPLMQDLMPHKGTPEELQKIRVPDVITHHYPPTFLMTATEDFLKPQAAMLASVLAEKDVPFVYRYCVNNEKKLAHVFHLDIRSEDSKSLNEEECAFFQSFC